MLDIAVTAFVAAYAAIAVLGHVLLLRALIAPRAGAPDREPTNLGIPVMPR
jgi:hypothetical protein